MKEVTDKTVSYDEIQKQFEKEEAMQIRLLTENVAALTFTVQAQNAVILTLLKNAKEHDASFAVPEWKDDKEAEAELGEILNECIDKVNKAYGPRKTNKS